MNFKSIPLTLPVWRHDVLSIFHALEIRQDLQNQNSPIS